MDRATWFKVAMQDAGTYKLYAGMLAEEVNTCFSNRDWDEAQAWLEALADSRSLCRDDSMRHTWAFYSTQLLGLKALKAVYIGEFHIAASLLASVHSAILDMEIRWPAHRWTVNRINRDSALASLKWLAPDRYRDFLATPQEVTAWWLDSDQHLHRFMQDDPIVMVGRRESMFTASSAAGIAVIKMIIRYAPDGAKTLIDYHNEQYGWALPLDSREISKTTDPSWGRWEVAAALESERRAPSAELLQEFAQNARTSVGSLAAEGMRSDYLGTVDYELDVLLERAEQRRPLEIIAPTSWPSAPREVHHFG